MKSNIRFALIRGPIASAVIIVFAYFLLAATISSAAAGLPNDRRALEEQRQSALQTLQSENPGIRLIGDKGRVERVVGRMPGSGTSPSATVVSFREKFAVAFGANPGDLRVSPNTIDLPTGQPIMYDPETGNYKFTLFSLNQYKDDIPVYGGELRVLVQNEADYPVVWVSPGVKDIRYKSFQGVASSYDPRQIAASAVDADFPQMTGRKDERLVIWTGQSDASVEPRVAVEFVGTDGDQGYNRWHYVVDAQTSEILLKEDMIVFGSGGPQPLPVYMYGSVSGLTTQGAASEQCEDETSEALKYAKITCGQWVAYTDTLGMYRIRLGQYPSTVASRLWGLWFRVFNSAGADALLTTTGEPEGWYDFLHNETNNEAERAQVNAYVEANAIRDMVKKWNPNYPMLSQNEFPIYVNRTDGYCPANAWYDASALTMNFCQSSGSYPNTAYSSIIHHEYGHHLVQMAGSGQGQYGEGMGDCVAVLMSDQPVMGLGMFGSCSSGDRTADNTFQYPCRGEVHYCGNLLSGCIWSTRNALAAAYPTTYLSILRSLTVNSILLHSGESITPEITIDFLTLDDNDGNIYNGTPHSVQIRAGFAAHNMDLPAGLTIWVSAATGNDITGDGSSSTPYATIGRGIQAASSFGDTVRVMPGVYSGQVLFGGKSVSIMSTNGPTVTTIQGTAGQMVVDFSNYEARDAALQGFTIDGGTIGARCMWAGPKIIGNIFKNQTSSGIYVYSDALYDAWNIPLIENCTIADCAGAGIRVTTLTAVPIRNTIVTRNLQGIVNEKIYWMLLTNPDVTYSDVWGNATNWQDATAGTGTISADPVLTSDFTLFRGSPCLDAGSAATAYNDPDGTRDDMGAVPSLQVSATTNYTSITAAKNAAQIGEVVLVSSGRYQESLVINKNLRLVSKNLDDRPRIVNNASTDLVVFTSGVTSAATLDGFILDTGRIAVWCQNAGPTIRRNLMRGQGITNWAAVVLSGSTWASLGNSPAVLINNTIVNSTNGAFSSFSLVAPTIKNTIIANCNYAVHNQGWLNGQQTAPPVLSYNDVWNCGGHYYNCPDTGVGTISANPLFSGTDFLLSSGSPCINAGDPDAQYIDPDASRNDMGYRYYTVGQPKTTYADDEVLPAGFGLSQNYPNPFNPTTEIEFSLPEAGQVHLDVCNILGQQVDVLVDGQLDAGLHRVTWDGANRASGIYFYRIVAGSFSESKKMLLIK